MSGSFTADNHWLLKCKPSSARCPTPSCADLPPNLHSHLCLHLTGGQRAGSDNEADGRQTAIQVHREGTQAHPPMHLSAVSAVEHLHDVFEQDDLACFHESPHHCKWDASASFTSRSINTHHSDVSTCDSINLSTFMRRLEKKEIIAPSVEEDHMFLSYSFSAFNAPKRGRGAKVGFGAQLDEAE